MRRIVISGGMGDIGRAVAERFAREGDTIAVLFHHSSEDEVNEFLHALPGKGHTALRCDITDASATMDVMQGAHEKMGSIEIAVHAAVSPIIRKTASAITPEEFRRQFEVTCFGGLNFFRAATPFLKGSGARLIGITTTVANSGEQNSPMAGYVSAKYALRGMLREFSRECAPQDIAVAAVAPPFVATRLHSDLPATVFNFLRDRQPAHLIATTEAVAETVVRVCGMPLADMNGKSFPVGEGEPAAL